jgi:uncharacterized protein
MLAELRRDLAVAVRARDPVATSALRSALAAIENAGAADPAEAPEPGVGRSPIAGSVRGLGAAEVRRRELTAAEVEEIVRAEVAGRLAAAGDYLRLGRRDRAERLRAEAAVLTRYLPATMGFMAAEDTGAVGSDVVDFFQRALRYLSSRIEDLDEDVLAWRPAPDTTPISNIVLHVLGSTVTGFTVAAGEPEERDRDAEFSAGPLPAAELVERIQRVERDLDAFRDRLTVADLVAVRPRPARNQTLTGLQVLLNGYGHVMEHVAQIELTRQLAEHR